MNVGKGWNNFGQLLPLQNVLLLVRGKLYTTCVHSYMLHGSETWPVKKENELMLQRAEMRMIRWMLRIKVTDSFTCSELRETTGIDEYSDTVTQVKMVWACSKKGRE